jgi:hypothetical protein
MGAFTYRFRPRFHLTLHEAASRFGVSAQMLSWGIRRGRLRFKRVMHCTWVTPTAVSTFVESYQAHRHLPWNTTPSDGQIAGAPPAS